MILNHLSRRATQFRGVDPLPLRQTLCAVTYDLDRTYVGHFTVVHQKIVTLLESSFRCIRCTSAASLAPSFEAICLFSIPQTARFTTINLILPFADVAVTLEPLLNLDRSPSRISKTIGAPSVGPYWFGPLRLEPTCGSDIDRLQSHDFTQHDGTSGSGRTVSFPCL